MEMERDGGIENVINDLSQHEKDVYRFMRGQYNRTLSYGDPYEDKMKDPQLTALVSREFNISAEEARNIYKSVESKMAGFEKERPEKN